MTPLLQALAVLFGIASVGVAVMALAAGYRAVRIAGWWLVFDGMVLFRRSDRVPAEAWPHLRRTMARWGLAMLCFVLAAAAGAISGALA